MTDIRVSVRNTSEDGGTFLTPFWFAFHDNGFDLYDRGVAASAGLEALAEDGSFDTINAEVADVDADGQVGAVFGAGSPPVIAAGELAAAVTDVDGTSNGYIDVAAMVLPSNDAFIGTGTSVELFDDDGNFLGAQRLVFGGDNVLDAGTEVNTELDAAFLNQTGPNTGDTEGGVVEAHPGFIGSEGGPAGEGNILGGTNAIGETIDPVAADFTRDGARVATVHINEAVTTEGSSDRDRIFGDEADDLVTGLGGNDLVFGRNGWDDISGGEGADKIFGQRGQDILSGDDGDDLISGGRGADVLAGGVGEDTLRGGLGRDAFLYSTGDEEDIILGFGQGRDVIVLNVDGFGDFDDVLGAAAEDSGNVEIDFGDGDSLLLVDVTLDDLSASNFDFI